MKHLQQTKSHVVYTRFRKTDDVFVPMVPRVQLPQSIRFVTTSKSSVAAALVIVLMFGSLFVSKGKELGTVAYFSDTESTLTNMLRAGEWGEPEVLVEIEAFSLMMEEIPTPEEDTLPDEGVVAGVADEVVEEEAVEESAPAPTEEQPQEPVEEIPAPEEIAEEETPLVEETPAPEEVIEEQTPPAEEPSAEVSVEAAAPEPQPSPESVPEVASE